MDVDMLNIKSPEEEIIDSIKDPLVYLMFLLKDEDKVKEYLDKAWYEAKDIYYEITAEVSQKV